MTKLSNVVIYNAARSETSEGDIILRGLVTADSLHLLKLGDYQRSVRPRKALASILDALEKGCWWQLPNIVLGMRGGQFEAQSGNYVLLNDVYIVDGLQRVHAAIQFAAEHPERSIGLYATIHFNTTQEWERDRFLALNSGFTKLSPNIVLRNRRASNQAVSLLYDLCVNDSTFVLHNRISWGQRMTKGQLLPALTFAKTVVMLHSHHSPTGQVTNKSLVPTLDQVMGVIGPQAMRENVKTFFQLIDDCWGVRQVQYRKDAAHLCRTFLHVLAKLVSDHHNFWLPPEEKKLRIETALKRKIATVPINGPYVQYVLSSGAISRTLLYAFMRDHINGRKRTGRLSARWDNGHRPAANSATNA